jgi:hypothetical protein
MPYIDCSGARKRRNGGTSVNSGLTNFGRSKPRVGPTTEAGFKPSSSDPRRLFWQLKGRDVA